MAGKSADDRSRESEARRALERVDRDSEVVGQSTFARTVDRARSHMAADDAASDDPVELWGRRTGRALAVVAFTILAIWLFGYLTR